MNKLISILYFVMIAAGITACSSPQTYGNSPDQQRKNAKEAQDELSKDVSSGSR